MGRHRSRHNLWRQGWICQRPTWGCSPATRYTYLSLVGAFYRWAVRTDLIVANPVDKIERPRRARRLPRPTDDDDLALAFAYAEPRMRAWLCLTALEGFRCCEIARLRVEDVDRHHMRIRAFGKGSKERTIPLHESTLSALTVYGIPTSGFVFTKLSGAGQPLSPSTVSRYIGRFYRELGSTATAHQNRHWFATQVHAATGDLLVTRDLLGHATSVTSEQYAKLLNGRAGIDAVNGLSV